MSLYMRQNRRGMGNVLAASFNQDAMRALVSSQRAMVMQTLQQGTAMSDLYAADPGYGMFEPRPSTSGQTDAFLWLAGAGAGVLVLGALGYAVYRRRRGA